MKRILLGSVLATALTLPALAGPDTTAPAADSKDMKDVKQMAPAPASDAGYYIAVFGGANFDTWYGDNRQTLTSTTGSTISSQDRIKSDWGGAGGFKIGYNYESFDAGFLRIQPAVEGEALYIGDDASSSFLGGTSTISTNSAAIFVNGIIRFKTGTIFTPYVGLGLGGEYLTTHEDLTGPGGFHATGIDTSDSDFAGQALVGFDLQITHNISLFSEYKFIDAIGNDGKSTNYTSTTYRFKPDQIQQNLVTAGLKYTF
jgi:opacity protein-like surface antigen